MIFASDNWAGASDKVAAALAAAARGPSPAYGNDPVTQRVAERFGELFEKEVAVHLVASGTAANALAISHFTRPGGVVLCHEAAHIAMEEAGAVPFFGGGLTMRTMPGDGAKIAAATLDGTLRYYLEATGHFGPPVALSLTQLNEWGRAYSADEVRALADLAHEAGMAVHMDGARFANAVAGTGATPADLTWRAGVDVMSFGGTKNGCLMAEAVVFFDPAAARDFTYARQRAGQGFSKNWVLAAQFEAYLEGGHWLELAGRANRAAKRLAAIFAAVAGVELAYPPDGNEVFPKLPAEIEARLKAAGALFHPWSRDPAGGPTTFRFVTSFQTSDAELDEVAAVLGVA